MACNTVEINRLREQEEEKAKEMAELEERLRTGLADAADRERIAQLKDRIEKIQKERQKLIDDDKQFHEMEARLAQLQQGQPKPRNPHHNPLFRP